MKGTHQCRRTRGLRKVPTSSQQAGRSHEQGLTLIECLVAITMVAITGALMTPPLFLAAATRIQNRRSEQALQLAQAEIDRVRTLVERNRQSADNLPAVSADFVTNPDQVPAPTGLVTGVRSPNADCTVPNAADLNTDGTFPTDPLKAISVDLDGDADCDAEFFVQTFRTDDPVSPSEPNRFVVGVRVYSAVAAGNLNQLEKEQASLNFTSGQGSQRLRPLAVLSSEMVLSDGSDSICEFHDLNGCPTPPTP